MAIKKDSHEFYIDVEELEAVQNILGATESQVKAAYNRAISRTARTVRSLANKEIRDSMQVKNLKAIRKRFQNFRLRSPSKQKKFDELRLWFGLNDMSVGYLRGRIRRNGSKRSPNGATFTPKGKMAPQTYQQGFIAHRYKRRSIFSRSTDNRYPIKEARVPVSEALQVTIEDEIFERLPEIFLKHFETDLKGRVKMGLNKRGWRE
ncbi:TPA: phage tail protein [Vibrio parahaemolyticus]